MSAAAEALLRRAGARTLACANSMSPREWVGWTPRLVLVGDHLGRPASLPASVLMSHWAWAMVARSALLNERRHRGDAADAVLEGAPLRQEVAQEAEVVRR